MGLMLDDMLLDTFSAGWNFFSKIVQDLLLLPEVVLALSSGTSFTFWKLLVKEIQILEKQIFLIKRSYCL